MQPVHSTVQLAIGQQSCQSGTQTDLGTRRAARTDRLKQAKAEAEKEIKAYRQQREEKYQKAISDVRLQLECAAARHLLLA